MTALVQIRFCFIDLPMCVLQILVRFFFGGSTLGFFCWSLVCSVFFCDIRHFDFSFLAGLCFSVDASCDFVTSKMFRSFDLVVFVCNRGSKVRINASRIRAPCRALSLSLFLRVSLSLSLSLLGVSCCPVCGSGLPLAPFKAPAAASQSVSQQRL